MAPPLTRGTPGPWHPRRRGEAHSQEAEGQGSRTPGSPTRVLLRQGLGSGRREAQGSVPEMGEAAEREVWTCKATLDAVTEVVFVLELVLSGAHRVPGKCAAQGRPQ